MCRFSQCPPPCSKIPRPDEGWPLTSSLRHLWHFARWPQIRPISPAVEPVESPEFCKMRRLAAWFYSLGADGRSAAIGRSGDSEFQSMRFLRTLSAQPRPRTTRPFRWAAVPPIPFPPEIRTKTFGQGQSRTQGTALPEIELFIKAPRSFHIPCLGSWTRRSPGRGPPFLPNNPTQL